MALGSLANVPGLAGYLDMQRVQQQRSLGDLQGAVGMLGALQRQQELEQAAQLAPIKMEFMKAQAEAMKAQPELRAREMEAAFAERQAKRQQDYDLALMRLNEVKESRLSRAQSEADRLAAQREFHEGRIALQREMQADRIAFQRESMADRQANRAQANADRAEREKRAGEEKAFNNVQSLRKEFNALPEVKNYRTVTPIIESIKNAKDTAAGDLDFIYAVGKILDPDSVVREGEMSLVVKSGSPLERIKGEINSVMGGGRLTPKTRQRLTEMLQSRVGEIKRGYDAADSIYRRNAQRMGLPENEIFMDYGAPSVPAAPAASSAPASPGGWSIRKK